MIFLLGNNSIAHNAQNMLLWENSTVIQKQGHTNAAVTVTKWEQPAFSLWQGHSWVYLGTTRFLWHSAGLHTTLQVHHGAAQARTIQISCAMEHSCMFSSHSIHGAVLTWQITPSHYRAVFEWCYLWAERPVLKTLWTRMLRSSSILHY